MPKLLSPISTSPLSGLGTGTARSASTSGPPSRTLSTWQSRLGDAAKTHEWLAQEHVRGKVLRIQS